jgi:hypothetical protein
MQVVLTAIAWGFNLLTFFIKKSTGGRGSTPEYISEKGSPQMVYAENIL